jgi:mono/diheme cytochrome c family protein
MIRRTKILRAASIIAAALPLALQLAAEGRQTAAPAASAPQSSEYFESSIRPVLAANCYDCHTDEKMGGLRLDSRDGLLKGGRSGPAIVPGDPDQSLLIQAVRQTRESLKMPKGGRLKAAEIDALTEWVRAGAIWPSLATPTPTVASEGKPAAAPASTPAYVIKPEQRAFWSFQPLHASPAPAVSHNAWPKTDIDRFVLARMESAGLSPVRAADKRTLLRRATLDLIGLPPTSDEIEAFEKDEAPDAFAKVVDRLLASPRYGETWGRLWLDVARYGEDD